MTTQEQTEEQLPGVRLGLPATGPGSVAGLGRRLLGVVIDGGAAYVLAAAIGGTATPRGWSSLTFLVETVVLLCLTGQTIGMAAVRVHVVPLAGGRIAPWMALARQVLLILLIPAVVTDADRRGLHDKATGVVVLNN